MLRPDVTTECINLHNFVTLDKHAWIETNRIKTYELHWVHMDEIISCNAYK